LPERGRHRLAHDLANVHAQALLEAVPTPTPVATVEVLLRFSSLRVGQDVIEVRLHHLFAMRAGIEI
jgi:hypothetical protein